MQKFILVALFVVVAFTHQGEANKDYLIGYLKSMNTGVNEAELKDKSIPDLIDMVIVGLQKLQGETDDAERASILGEHIKSFQEHKSAGQTKEVEAETESPNEAVSLVHHVESEEDFDNQLKNAGDKIVLVDFFATWCGPCKRIAPVLDTFAAKYSDNLVILKVDVDELNELAMVKYVVSGMPTFIFFKNGKTIERFSGAYEERIEETIKKNIA